MPNGTILGEEFYMREAGLTMRLCILKKPLKWILTALNLQRLIIRQMRGETECAAAGFGVLILKANVTSAMLLLHYYVLIAVVKKWVATVSLVNKGLILIEVYL